MVKNVILFNKLYFWKIYKGVVFNVNKDKIYFEYIDYGLWFKFVVIDDYYFFSKF